MNVLLLSMPDSFEHMPSIVIRMPNGALTSLAGNVDPHHRVAVADLILAQKNVRRTVEQLVREWQPQVVGLSVMTFQRKTAIKIISLIRSLKPDVKVAVGGYDPSLASEPYMTNDAGVDFIIRGEGELTFRELLRVRRQGAALERRQQADRLPEGMTSRRWTLLAVGGLLVAGCSNLPARPFRQACGELQAIDS